MNYLFSLFLLLNFINFIISNADIEENLISYCCPGGKIINYNKFTRTISNKIGESYPQLLCTYDKNENKGRCMVCSGSVINKNFRCIDCRPLLSDEKIKNNSNTKCSWKS